MVRGNSDLIDTLEVEPPLFLHSASTLVDVPTAARDCLRTRAALQLEVLALRHRLRVQQALREATKLTAADRLLRAELLGFWTPGGRP